MTGEETIALIEALCRITQEALSLVLDEQQRNRLIAELDAAMGGRA